jgi:ATP phosphoribosyltransferase regulatory subunit
VDRDGALLALRPELTSLVARTVATRFVKRERPVRLCYSGEVFRYDDPAERAAREFHQLGVEHVGEPDVVADIEVLLVAAEALTALGLSDFRIALSHVDFFNGVADYLKLKDADRAELRERIDRRNSLALEEFLQAHAAHVEAARRAGFSRMIQIAGKRDLIRRAREILLNERSRAAVDYLDQIYSTMEALGLGENFDIDLGNAGGLEYYTGLTFKVYVPDCGVEIGGGGRYDNLIASFGRPEPAVGFSLALDELARAISLDGEIQGWQGVSETRTIPFEGDPASAFAHARELRSQKKQVKIDVK